MTKVELAGFRAYLRSWKAPAIHKIAHKYDRATRGLVGYERMKADERWAKKYPEQISISYVDDAFFAGSHLVFVTHETQAAVDIDGSTKPSWMGVSVYYVPQCTGEKPIHFFLYPTAVEDLIDELKKIKKRQETYAEVRRDRRRDRRWRRTRT